VEGFILQVLTANPWLIWVFLGLFVLVVFIAVLIQQREFRSPFFGIGGRTPPPTASAIPSAQPIQQTFNLGQQLTEEQYEIIYQRFIKRWEAEHPNVPAAISEPQEKATIRHKTEPVVLGNTADAKDANQDEIPARPPLFTPVEPPTRVVELFKIKLTVDNKVRKVFFARGGDGWAGVGMASVETFLDYSVNAGFITRELADEVRGLHGEMIPWIYGQDVPDEFFERIQIIASDIIRRLDIAEHLTERTPLSDAQLRELVSKVSERVRELNEVQGGMVAASSIGELDPYSALHSARYAFEKKLITVAISYGVHQPSAGALGRVAEAQALNKLGVIPPDLVSDILDFEVFWNNVEQGRVATQQEIETMIQLAGHIFNKLATVPYGPG
jgi:hypothetical protein